MSGNGTIVTGEGDYLQRWTIRSCLMALFKAVLNRPGHVSVADLEIFRGGFSFTKMPAKFEVKTKNPTH